MGVDRDKLTAPFPREAVKQRKGGGGRMLDYVEGHSVIHRLNDATEGQWDFKVISLQKFDNLYLATVEMTIPGLGTRQHIGVQMATPGGGEDLVKGAVTDALKKAATLFGVGLELYGPDYGSMEAAPANQRQSPQVQQRPNNPAPARLYGSSPANGNRPPTRVEQERARLAAGVTVDGGEPEDPFAEGN